MCLTMNNICKPILIIMLSFLLGQSAAFASNKPSYFDPSVEQEINRRVHSLNSVIQIKFTEEVKEKIWFYVERHRTTSQLLLGRINMYFPMFENALREKALPDELKYLAVIESSLLPYATSRAGATGLWQFMRNTAKLSGLKITSSIDERKDPIKSTEAALNYLKLLYTEYQDWTLAIAAYNCGSGTLNKAIQKANGNLNYWEISKYLPAETQKYVPKFIAMMYMMSYFTNHGLTPEQIDENLKFTATTKIYDRVDLKKLAKKLSLDYDIVRHLNPSYIKHFIPKSQGSNLLTLPQQKLYDFLGEHYTQEQILYVQYQRYNNFPVDLPQFLMTSSDESESELTDLTISSETKVCATKMWIDEQLDQHINRQKNCTIEVVKLQKGQSLLDLSKSYDVPLSSIMQLNGFSEDNLPSYGSVIKINRSI